MAVVFDIWDMGKFVIYVYFAAKREKSEYQNPTNARKCNLTAIFSKLEGVKWVKEWKKRAMLSKLQALLI